MDNDAKKLALVLGMHRSGTSLISRALKVFGAEHGDNLLSTTLGNVKGHWEDEDFFLLNKQMLSTLDKSWDSVLPITENDVEILRLNGYLKRAQKLFDEKFTNIDFFALKEPRMTKLMLFWNKALENIPTVYYIFAVRNPLNVAKSLQKRSNMPIEKGLLLWYSYNAYALQALRGKKVLIIDYDSFLSDPAPYLERLGAAFNVAPDEEEREIFLQSFLDKNLRSFTGGKAQEYSVTEKNYVKFYRYILKNSMQNYLGDDFYDAYNNDAIYTTLESMSNNQA